MSFFRTAPLSLWSHAHWTNVKCTRCEPPQRGVVGSSEHGAHATSLPLRPTSMHTCVMPVVFAGHVTGFSCPGLLFEPYLQKLLQIAVRHTSLLSRTLPNIFGRGSRCVRTEMVASFTVVRSKPGAPREFTEYFRVGIRSLDHREKVRYDAQN